MKYAALVAMLLACGGGRPAAPPPPPPPPTPSSPQVGTVVAHRAFLGTRFEPGTTRVVQVVPNSPAAKADIQVGDEIMSIDGVTMLTAQQIIETVGPIQAGTRITIGLRRKTTLIEKSFALGKRPPDEKLTKQTLLDRPAPAFTATGLDGTASFTLTELRGRVVLLDFWATWCGPCTTQFPHLQQWHQQYASKGLQIVALSDEEPDLVREYVAAEKLGYPIALDPRERIRAAYLVPGIPTTVVIDKAGIVRYVAVGTSDPREVEAVITQLLK
ncbi:MAG TPA: redoxin domain-containing protein [Kofleriaceae bacterium]